jgi:ATP-dependent DNA helicase RecG
VGKPVTVTLRVRNVGKKAFSFDKGGRNRAARDNQFRFTAEHDGKPVIDISSTNNHGGLSVAPIVKPGEVFEDEVDLKVKMFPEIAIRELIANALIHQDFRETGSSVMIEIYADRIEISNPGVPSISPDRFIDEYRSRNERLADLMRRLGICEEKGSGVDKVIHSSEVFQLPAPDFRVGDHRTSAVLFAHMDFEEMDRSARIRACYQHCCLRYVMNEKMTKQTLRERFKLPTKKAESVSRVIRDTVEAEKIRLADPSAKSTRYRSYVPFWA